MKNKKILVLLKYYKGELNPFDGSALECALGSGAGEIIALTMAPPSALEAFKGTTRLGVRAIMLSDKAYAGSDTIATSFILSEAIKKINPDLIFCGRQSVDGDTAQVPPMLARRLGYGLIVKAMSLDGESVVTRSGEQYSLTDRTIVTFEKIRTLRFPSIFSRAGSVEVWDNTTLNLPVEKCGLSGSPTRVVKSYESSVGRRECKFFAVDMLDRLIKQGLSKARSSESNTNQGEKLEEAYFIGNAQSAARKIAKNAIRLDVEGKTAQEVSDFVRQSKAKAVLIEGSDSLKQLASAVAVDLEAGLCADCIDFSVNNGRLIMTRPALGGNVTADIVCNGAVALATVKIATEQSSDVTFAVGKGAIEWIDQIKALAKRYGAEVVCSRIVADSGVMPYEAQVGLTGRTVSPKVYVAFGISGAVQHTCAISGAGTVIAVNVDKQARIFDYADYGIISEVKYVEL